MKKITTTKPSVTVETVIAKVRPVVDGIDATWIVGRCFLLSMSGASSPEMVDIRPPRRNEGVYRGLTKQERIDAARTNAETARVINTALKFAGFQTALDGASVYVKIV